MTLLQLGRLPRIRTPATTRQSAEQVFRDVEQDSPRDVPIARIDCLVEDLLRCQSGAQSCIEPNVVENLLVNISSLNLATLRSDKLLVRARVVDVVERQIVVTDSRRLLHRDDLGMDIGHGKINASCMKGRGSLVAKIPEDREMSKYLEQRGKQAFPQQR